MSVEITRLPSGLTIVTDVMPHLETAALGVWAGVGGRDEALDEHGISHLLEHMAFKGTRRRNARRLLGDSHPRHQGEQQASACQAPSGLDNKTGLKRILHVAGNLTAAPKLRQVQSELSARARAR